MRVGVEEAVVEHLGGVVVHELLADLGEVVAAGGELAGVVDGYALDVVHHDHVARAERRVRLRALEELAPRVVAAELLEVAGLDEEVGLLAEGLPQLVHHALEVEELVGPHEAAEPAGERAHDGDVLGHNLLHMRPLDLDGHELARDQARLVHLGDRGGAEGVVVDGVEDVLDGAVVLGSQGREDRVAIHGLHVRAQAGELACERRRENLRAHGEDLACLDEGGAQLLEHVAQALGREAVENVVAADDGEHLADAAQARGAREVVEVAALGAAAEDADGRGVVCVHVAHRLAVPVVQDLVITVETGLLLGVRLHGLLVVPAFRHCARYSAASGSTASSASSAASSAHASSAALARSASMASTTSATFWA